ncbi:MAG: rhodanese-like domain-containing protein [bacterium]|nr:rhodanese-like domain-containing protein [bacterium]
MTRWSNLLFVHLIVLVGTVAMAGNIVAAEDYFNYITPEKTKSRIQSGEAVTLLDIQIEDEYARHHIRGSLATYAYPVKSDAQKAKLDRVIPNLSANTDPIVIICPRGGGGAKRTFEYLASRGIESKRMFILEKGQSGWPYPQLVANN